MELCISQVTTLMNPFDSDASAYRGGGWTAVELWLTKLETFVQAHSVAEAADLFESAGVRRSPRPDRAACCSRAATAAPRTGTTSGDGWPCWPSWACRP